MTEKLNNFDRQVGALNGLPDVIHTKPSTLRVVPLFGVGTQTYIIQTYRQKEKGDTIFLEMMDEGGSIRIVLPDAVAETIARQREMLNGKSRSKAAKLAAEDRKARGIQPGFLKANGAK